MSATFITATGTDIGKTFVAAGLIRQLRATGKPVGAIKPVATGFDPAEAASTDPGVLLAALQRPPTPAAIDNIAPWRFAAPLSPDMAALRENRALDFGSLIGFTRNAINGATGMLLIEGIGGVMVPLDESRTVLDWIAALRVPVLLITGSYLGSLSHTLTALDALRRRDIAIKAVVVNETPRSTVPMADVMQTLRRFAKSVPLVALPRLAAGASHPAFGEIAALLQD